MPPSSGYRSINFASVAPYNVVDIGVSEEPVSSIFMVKPYYIPGFEIEPFGRNGRLQYVLFLYETRNCV